MSSSTTSTSSPLSTAIDQDLVMVFANNDGVVRLLLLLSFILFFIPPQPNLPTATFKIDVSVVLLTIWNLGLDAKDVSPSVVASMRVRDRNCAFQGDFALRSQHRKPQTSLDCVANFFGALEVKFKRQSTRVTRTRRETARTAANPGNMRQNGTFSTRFLALEQAPRHQTSFHVFHNFF